MDHQGPPRFRGMSSSESSLPRHSNTSRGNSITARTSRCTRLLLYGGALYVIMVVFFLFTYQSLVPTPAIEATNERQAVETVDDSTASFFDEDADAVAKAEEHARTVKMLPPGETTLRELQCIGWRATDDCSPHGPRLPHKDKPCYMSILPTQSGYCEVEDKQTKERFRVMRRYCRSVRQEAKFRCYDAEDFVHFPILARQAVSKALVPNFQLPHVEQGGGEPTYGIAMVVYPKMVPSAYATIRVLREVLHCRLSIELWYRPKEVKAAPGSLLPLEQLAESAGKIVFREIDDANAIGFGAKVFAIYNSFFERVLFLDSDNVPVRDPSFLFELPEFHETGAVFWPDFWHPRSTIFNIHGQSLLWEMLDQPFKNMFEQESGQLVIDRRRHAVPLELVRFYTFHTPNHFKSLELVHGDKDLFRLAWLKLKSPYFMIQAPPSVAGKVFNNTFCGVTMVQHDTKGEVLFLHRNTRKLTGELKLQNVNLRTAAALRAKKKILLTRPEGRTKPTMEEVEEELRNGPPAPTMDPPEPDGYPDAVYWTHMLSFRNTSKIVHYQIDVHQKLDGFPNGQTCYGLADMLEENKHFYYRDFADFSFAGIETQLRRFAVEAAQVLRAQQHITEVPAIQLHD